MKIDLQMNENSEIELFIKKDTPSRLSYPEDRGLRHLAIKTHHIEEDMIYLKSKGIRVEEPRIDEITNKKMVFFYDPDELPIELHE